MTFINIVIGDWSHDGHSQTDETMYQMNVSAEGLKTAFDAGTKIVGFDLTKECRDYEDCILSKDACGKVKEHFQDSDIATWIIENEANEEDFYVETEMFAEIYLLIAELGNPELTYSLVNCEDVRIGGYGLFS